jgi:hypothetical protein
MEMEVSMNEKQMRLLNLADLDPERWKPLTYPVTADIPVVENGLARCSIVLNNKPYVLTRIATSILGNTRDPETSGIYNDGQYTLEMSDEMIQYTAGPIMADLLCGPKETGENRNMEFPIYFAGTHTLTFTIANLYTRILSPKSDTFKVQIIVGGLCDWGPIGSGQ